MHSIRLAQLLAIGVTQLVLTFVLLVSLGCITTRLCVFGEKLEESISATLESNEEAKRLHAQIRGSRWITGSSGGSGIGLAPEE